MKVYTKHEQIRIFLQSQDLEGITIIDQPKDSDYMITGRYSKKDYHPTLKGIIIPYTGHNGIDLDDMRKDHLRLFITPTRSKYVAEKVMALTLTLLGNVIPYHQQLKKGDWSKRNTDQRKAWVSVHNKTIGLLGYGRIGQLVHQMFKGFNCHFYTINRHKTYDDIDLVNNLSQLVDVSDIIIISLPLNHQTENIIDEALLSKMQDKYLINVGRGKLIDQKALYDALKNHTLAGFASDVWYNYPKNEETCFPSDYPIHEMDNVVLSNHSGGFTTETNQAVYQDLVKQLIKLKNNDLSDALDLSKLI